MNRTIATAVLLSLTLAVLLTHAADDATATAPAEVVPERISQVPTRPAVLPVLYASYVALQTGVRRQFDQAAKYLVQLYSDMEGPQVVRRRQP